MQIIGALNTDYVEKLIKHSQLGMPPIPRIKEQL
jgi:hypothetical protein